MIDWAPNLIESIATHRVITQGTTKMASFPQPGDDVLGRLTRSRRLHSVAAAAIGDSGSGSGSDAGVQLHHVQAVFKEAHSSYAFAWHQGP